MSAASDTSFRLPSKRARAGNAAGRAQIDSLVASTSLGSVTYQAKTLLRQLGRINDQEYLPEACKIKDVFECIAEHVLAELWAMQNRDRLFEALDDDGFSRTRALARILHQLHSFLRYLWASSPRQSPPGVQYALKLLTDLHFPKKNGAPICLVRPQWKYNLTYVPMTGMLRKSILVPSVLDPNGLLGPSDPDLILLELWKRHSKTVDEKQLRKLDPTPPEQVAILSFAGLDTDDTLSYPLLAHELGHFIDLSSAPPLSSSPSVNLAAQIREEEVRQILEQHLGPSIPARAVTQNHKALVDRVFVALKEIVADLLATRMMGLGYFAAHSEFLKTLANWPQPTLTDSGYPGIKYRLRLVLEHLLDPDGCDIRTFLEESTVASEPAVREIAEGVQQYISAWERRVELAPGDSVTSPDPIANALNHLAVQAVERAHSELLKLAKQAVPQEHCCKIGNNFFERIRLLDQHLPPSCPGESSVSFAEITAAAWAYQILFGEQKEHDKETLDEQNNEYLRICQLALKAIELIPTRGGDRPSPLATPSSASALSKSGALSGPDIIGRLLLPLGHQQRLAVIPFQRKAVNAASLDVHLGNWFVIARRTRLPSVKMNDAGQRLLMSVGREEAFVLEGQTFLIHPGDLILGATLEFLALAPDIMGSVEGKSGIGRVGLLVATATTIAPGFHGVVVLELANTGTVPLELVPGMPIAQLVLQVTTNPVPQDLLYRGRYYCQTKP
jgi:dCTP deaminase